MNSKIIITLAAIALLSACSIKEDRIDCLAPVKVHLDGFSISQEELPATKATNPATYSAVNAITLAFYDAEGTEVYKSTQSKSDGSTYTTFGDFDLSLRMDSYTMVAIAYTTKDGSPFELTSPTSAAFTGAHVYETFAYTQAVDIEDTDPVELSATLDRIVSMLSVISSDTKPSNASSVRMILSAGGKSFNPTTGLATVNTGFANTVTISTAVGVSSTSSTCVFLASDEQTMDVTIEVLDEHENVLFSKLVEDVPFKRNRKTKLMGNIYSASSSSSFLLDTSWLDEETLSF